MAAGAIGACGWSGGGRRHLRKILDAAKPAAGASAHRPAARQMRLQPFTRNRDLDLPAVVDPLDLDAPNVLDRLGDLLGQRKPAGEILEILRRRHHDREGRGAYDDLNRRLDGDRPGEVGPTRAGIVGKVSDRDFD